MRIPHILKIKRLSDQAKHELTLIGSTAVFHGGVKGAFNLFGAEGAPCELPETRWNTDRAIRLYTTKEFAFVLLAWIDRTIFDIVGARKRDYPMDHITIGTMAAIARWDLEGCPAEPFSAFHLAFDWVADSLREVYKSEALRLVEQFNDFQQWASPFDELMRPGDQSPNGTLLWEFGKRMATLVSQNDEAVVALEVYVEVADCIISCNEGIQYIAKQFKRA